MPHAHFWRLASSGRGSQDGASGGDSGGDGRGYGVSIRVGDAAAAPSFQKAAHTLLKDNQLRTNVRHATDVITRKRAHVVAEQQDWQRLRDAGSAIKAHTLRYLDHYLA